MTLVSVDIVIMVSAMLKYQKKMLEMHGGKCTKASVKSHLLHEVLYVVVENKT